ncbi:aldehyde dehydrogenase [Daedaleopsis nitida]|nr:aldehyde dehydrogenase [Daedaleopsis nitida]
MSDQYTPLDEIPKIHETARRAFNSGRTKSIPFRKQQIARMGYMIKDNEARFKEALRIDLGRHDLETEFFDFGPVYKEVRIAYDNVEKWTKPVNVEFNLSWFAMGPKMKAEPKGVVLIVPAFNLPLFLSMIPLAGVLAAGCAAVIKPSEANPTVNKLLAELVPKYLDPELVQVVQGAVAETTKALELRWNHIIYIGGGQVARIIAAAAAKHLTPVTLELGGKNPVVVDPNVDLKMTARRLLWGRAINAGQVCTAPEYVLVPRKIQDALIAEFQEAYTTFYPDGPENSDSLSRIVSQKHAARIKGLLDNTKGEIILGGKVDVEKRYVAPTIVNNVSADDSLMSECVSSCYLSSYGEVFGPVLSLVPVEDVDEALEFIRTREEHSLAVYVFTADKKFRDKVWENTKSGAALANETIISPGIPGAPVGGVGASGYGYYAGKWAFEQFTHWRVMLDNPGWIDSLAMAWRYPPYKPGHRAWIDMIYPALPARPKDLPAPAPPAQNRHVSLNLWIALFVVGASSAVLTRYWPLLQLKA